jgi:D-alanyl-D-alanine carboxypeptidase/D-alanyl-D-alanine-endopeptidase (penicillin-binding protein 4)
VYADVRAHRVDAGGGADTLPSRMARLGSVLLVVLGCLVAPAAAAASDLAGTRAALSRSMGASGARSGALVVDLATGRTLYASRATTPRVPASVTKLFTTSAALRGLGPHARLATEVLTDGPVLEDGTLEGDLYLRGAGDPSFGTTDLEALARGVAATGLEEVDGRVVGDEAAFDRRRGPPSSHYATSGYVGPLSALSFNRGLTGIRAPFFQASPGLFAAQALERALRRAGVAVRARARTGVTPATAVALVRHAGPPLADLVARTNRPSDNYYAETLLKVLGARLGRGGSTRAGTAVVRAEMGRLGIAPRVVDGSGLSRSNRTSPAQVVRLLRVMAADPVAGPPLEASFPVAGRSGTLTGRMRRTPAAGNCMAKTGTLNSVSALAGYCTAADGRTRTAFAFLMNGVYPSGARRLQDAMAVALARYEP